VRPSMVSVLPSWLPSSSARRRAGRPTASSWSGRLRGLLQLLLLLLLSRLLPGSLGLALLRLLQLAWLSEGDVLVACAGVWCAAVGSAESCVWPCAVCCVLLVLPFRLMYSGWWCRHLAGQLIQQVAAAMVLEMGRSRCGDAQRKDTAAQAWCGA
jgi:hypothetical protein